MSHLNVLLLAKRAHLLFFDYMKGIALIRIAQKNIGRIFGGRFRATGVLKQGYDRNSWLGEDLSCGAEVVIKTISSGTLSQRVRLRLEYEAQMLREILGPTLQESSRRALWHKPTIPFMLQIGDEGDLIFLVRPFIPGISLHARLAQRPLSVVDTLTIGCSLMATLREAHNHGILHRNVKPSNIIVDRGMPLKRATPVDFGLPLNDLLESSLQDIRLKAIRYFSPEQAGLLNREPDHRSDLYSAGVILYESLAGTPPFDGWDIGQLLRQHLSMRPPELQQKDLAIPNALDEVVRRLLRKDPKDRYQSAQAVLSDLNEIGYHLQRGVDEPSIVVGGRDLRSTLTESAFIGREEELDRLERQCLRAKEGEGGLVLVEADSGEGKTRLLEAFSYYCTRMGAWVLRGHGVEQAVQEPFQLLEGVLHGVVETARTQPECELYLKEELGNDLELVCRILPGFDQFPGREYSESFDLQSHGAVSSWEAMGALFTALGSRQKPTVILLDDVHLGDERTLKFLEHWQYRNPYRNGRRNHLLIVVSFCSEEVPEGHLLRSLSPMERIFLPSFGKEDLRKFLESMSGTLPSEVVEMVASFSRRNPFMADAILGGMIETGALRFQGDSKEPLSASWRYEPTAKEGLQTSWRASALLKRRLERLSKKTLSFLSGAAVLGREFDLEFAAALSGQLVSETNSFLVEARRKKILWPKSTGKQCAFVHNALREALLARLSDEEKNRLHRLAAICIEAQDEGRTLELAYHFDAAGEYHRAFPYALEAAEQTRSPQALEMAERHYRLLEKGAANKGEAMQRQIAKGLGDILLRRNKYTKAEEQMKKEETVAMDEVAQAKIDEGLGELAFKRGELSGAKEALERGLRKLGRGVPETKALIHLFLLWEYVVQLLHTFFPKLFLSRRTDKGAEAKLLAVRLYSRFASCHPEGTAEALWSHLRELNLAECFPPTRELVQAYANHSVTMALRSFYNRGVRFAEKGLEISRSLGDVGAEGHALHMYGRLLCHSSRFVEAIEKFNSAITLLKKEGHQWGVQCAYIDSAYCLYRLGDLRGAVERCRSIEQVKPETGENPIADISLHIWAKAVGGKVPPEAIQAALHRSKGNVQVFIAITQARGVAFLMEGHHGEAVSMFREAQSRAHDAGLRTEGSAPILPWLATALRRQFESLPVLAPRCQKDLFRQAKKVARKGLRLAQRFQNNLPHALRESGLLAALAGKEQQAKKLLNDGLTVAKRQGAQLEHAQTLLARGEVGVAYRWPSAEEDLAKARRALYGLGAEWALQPSYGAPRQNSNVLTSRRHATPPPLTLSLLNRFPAVLEGGQRICSAHTKEGIFDAVRETALTLLRGEECTVLEAESQDSLDPLSGLSIEARQCVSTVIDRVLTTGRLVVVSEGLSENANDRVILAGVRSILCAPIFVRGDTVGCFYVMHQQVDGLFGEEEKLLAAFIATLAGVALGNAKGCEEVTVMTQALEKKVEDWLGFSHQERGLIISYFHHLT